ncbi:aminotransferase class V-fold PLP-dependent enzyme [Saccharopolyspora rhizosphaerae]|uniref:Aminotransferase class V-fold PLP-dependent enzyme n=1 Tax=Saccharopolyspora rhizosphaerae TaxID=2492662 RepID=A0A426JSH8_9PSEU|nr:aminotransferase class V-fold PLP-dependent enzyme [Saccharopolyspora rhizosphaerae]RRO16145.1 aminotransferase class V-fold PLP-dependent enzyme [Saccharopolyspora rhizosphaerae]
MRKAFDAVFDVPDGYLNTASIGIPPTETSRKVAEAVERWGRGQDRPGDFDEAVATARDAFARLVGVPTDRVAVGASASQVIGLVAASTPDGSRVLVARDDFTSVLFPFAAQAGRGVTVTEVDLDEIGRRAAEFDVVAVSAVQSKDGRTADFEALQRARNEHGTRVLLDVTQAAGWMPLSLDWADWVAAAGYKWLMAPRGSAWLAVHPDAPRPVAHSANWYAAEDPWEATYGLPLRLAEGARGLDLSPVWLAQVGAAASMEWLARLDREEVAAHCRGLADGFRAELGLPPAGSAIVSLARPDAVAALTDAGVACASRGGQTRVSFHLYNTEDDVERAVRALL